MSTAQDYVTAEPGNGPAAIRARVGDSAIDKVTRLFSAASPIFSPRRCKTHAAAGPTASPRHRANGDTTRVTLADDGAGIADPAS